MRVVFAGTPEVAVPALDAVAASRHELIGVVTRPDAPSGRGRKLVASPVAQRAEELGVPVLKPRHPREPDFQAALAELRPDACPVVAYGALLPQSALDAGPVFGFMTERIRPDDTAGDLLARLAEGGSGLLVQTLDGIEDGSLQARDQPEDGISFAPKILVDDARVEWTHPAVAIERQVRACTPAPGAWSTVEGERIKIGPLVAVDGPVLAPGVLEVTKNAVLVGTGTTPLRLGDVKAFGKRQMGAADWARGVRLASGARLGD